MENKKIKFLSHCYLLTKPKNDLSRVLDKKGFVSFFVREDQEKEKIMKTYYDAQGFFNRYGIRISIVISSKLNYAQLVVRLESQVERLKFLQDMPDKFVKKISPKDSISKYYSYITDCVNDMYPNGFNTNVASFVSMLRPIMTVVKKNEKIRLINNHGLKYFLCYGPVEYQNKMNGSKEKNYQLEVVLDYTDDLQKYYNLIHRIEMQVPSILKLSSSDIMNGLQFTQSNKK